MKRFSLLFLFSFFFFHFSFAQSGTWTWISGDSTPDVPAVYGTMGVPSIYNHPVGDYEMVEWKDHQGNFWLYGGTYPGVNDLWKFDPLTLEWTWMKGDSTKDAYPVYGTKGCRVQIMHPAPLNSAGATWVDTSGALWLFGGLYRGNDLWKYDIGSNCWTWMNGSQSFTKGYHGTLGVPGTTVTPGLEQKLVQHGRIRRIAYGCSADRVLMTILRTVTLTI